MDGMYKKARFTGPIAQSAPRACDADEDLGHTG
jgi:hypothetical protein